MDQSRTSFPIRFKDKKGRSIVIRPYERTDHDKLQEMYDYFEPKGLEAGLPPPEDNVRHHWLQTVTSSFFNLIALHRDQVVGHAALDLWDPSLCPEYLIFILQGFRNCGLGTAMSEIMRDMAQDSGCKKIWLTVRSANTCAIRVFKKVRFRFRGGIDIDREMELIIRQKTSPHPSGKRKTTKIP
ncbi:MAG: GNAT family N-acetyltransferase [Deltaproteobacteria bacterium]|nr:GNAT family N-acetyltransferase [Deltaproteobacteria bacterium]MBW1928627.1 GNAT family N-acetyltransferase [Deltaproteobacteria bacterium]MBW2024688.1 GNAT family N-acetyltransferase [Deltaproteobacteria bacterium]MBW2126798.1 GNAT family N-acetyltransferase [Deltaproteobacteria bacterium]RLB20595.1 MAG: hypothetical protein DRG76_10725 [Deltaproteobacteria bacterium]